MDAKYFDDFPLIFNEPVLGQSDIAGFQYPQPDSQEALQNICHAKYGEKYRKFGGEINLTVGGLATEPPLIM